MESHQQLLDYWQTLNWPIVSCRSPNSAAPPTPGLDSVRRCFAAAFITQVATSSAQGRFQTLFDQKEVFVHPTSCLANQKQLDVIVFMDLALTTKQYMRTVLKIERDWIVEFQPHLQRAKMATPKTLQ